MTASGRGLTGLLLLACAVAHAEPTTPPVEAAPPALRDAGAPGVSVEARLREIQRRVQRALRYPASARARGVGGEARVGFEIQPDGRPANVALLASSGSASLDRAAERAVHEAGALPPVLGRVVIPVRFRLVDGDADSD